MTRKFFGTDGIRGTTNPEPMTAEMALRVGRRPARTSFAAITVTASSSARIRGFRAI